MTELKKENNPAREEIQKEPEHLDLLNGAKGSPFTFDTFRSGNTHKNVNVLLIASTPAPSKKGERKKTKQRIDSPLNDIMG